jgi:HEAT repeat protein
MARSLEDTLNALNELRKDPTSPESVQELRRILNAKNSFATSRAAEIVGKFEIEELTPELVAAFERFLIEPEKSDKNCKAKESIAEALYQLDARSDDVFLRGVRHVQLEKAWGASVDTAANLRGWCALGLVRVHHPDVVAELIDLLADSEPRARQAAAKALACKGNAECVALLRFKALVGDADPEVLAECLSGLVETEGEPALPLIARLLEHPDEPTQEVAALALGASRLEAAFPILREWWERAQYSRLRRLGLVAIASLRRDAAVDFLLSLVSTETSATALDALGGL